MTESRNSCTTASEERMLRCTWRHTTFECEWNTGVCFFVSSRRRHTRFDCDWSSDVCSSDLQCGRDIIAWHQLANAVQILQDHQDKFTRVAISGRKENLFVINGTPYAIKTADMEKIGRASCRERV